MFVFVAVGTGVFVFVGVAVGGNGVFVFVAVGTGVFVFVAVAVGTGVAVGLIPVRQRASTLAQSTPLESTDTRTLVAVAGAALSDRVYGPPKRFVTSTSMVIT